MKKYKIDYFVVKDGMRIDKMMEVITTCEEYALDEYRGNVKNYSHGEIISIQAFDLTEDEKKSCGVYENDEISNPSHYTFSKFQPKNVIREWGLNFNLGCAVKYIVRAGKKDGNPTIKDLEKARQYISFELEYLKENSK